jgi:hypothetical protein
MPSGEPMWWYASTLARNVPTSCNIAGCHCGTSFRPEGGFFAFGEAATVLREIEAAASPTNALDPRD